MKTRQMTPLFSSSLWAFSVVNMKTRQMTPILIFILKLLASTVFLVISSGAYFRKGGEAIFFKKRGRWLFKKKRVIHMKFKNFAIVSFQITVNDNHYEI